jgi:hydroxymethylpyrimidine pyrophosphatase-like HAD family hydrolase
MKGKTVVFDIDGTLVDEIGYLIKHAPKYLEEKGLPTNIINPEGYSVANIFGLRDFFAKEGKLTDKELDEKCKKVSQGFWDKHFVDYTHESLREGSVELINELQNKGIKVVFVTMRGKKSTSKPNESLLDKTIRTKIVPFLTYNQLKRNGIKDINVVYPETTEDKIAYINNLNPDYVFEDQIDIIKNIDDSIKKVCISCNHNIHDDIPNNTIRLDNYTNVENLNIIPNKQVINSGNINHYKFKKNMTETVYQMFRKPITKWIKNK